MKKNDYYDQLSNLLRQPYIKRFLAGAYNMDISEIEMYDNYHCHTDHTNPTMSDSIVKTKDYIKRARTLGHTSVFTTEHGGTRDVYPVYGECKDSDDNIVDRIDNYLMSVYRRNGIEKPIWLKYRTVDKKKRLETYKSSPVFSKFVFKYDLKMVVSAEAYYTDDLDYSRHKDEKFLNTLFEKCYELWLKKNKKFLEGQMEEVSFAIHEIPLMADKKKRDKAFAQIFKPVKKISDEILETYDVMLKKIKKMDRKNYHLMLIALNENGQEEINRVLSEANVRGMYNGRPRIDRKLLLSLPKDDVIVTSACVGGRLFTDGYMDKFFNPVFNHFDKNFYLEVQDHKTPLQIEWNKKIFKLREEYGVQLIHGCDSHYIFPEDAKDRDDYIKGKGIWYDDEENFVLDYPSRNEIVERYKAQGVLSDDEIQEALNNTLISDRVEDLGLNKEIKMPTIYPELTAEERFDVLNDIVKKKMKIKLNKEVPKKRWKEYLEAMLFEMNIIKETSIPSVRTCDYFLINQKIIEIGINKYGGVLTKTGRGSAVSFLTNHLLGFTEVDRLDAEVPLYPTRFMSASRILKSVSLPDNYNCRLY